MWPRVADTCGCPRVPPPTYLHKRRTSTALCGCEGAPAVSRCSCPSGLGSHDARDAMPMLRWRPWGEPHRQSRSSPKPPDRKRKNGGTAGMASLTSTVSVAPATEARARTKPAPCSGNLRAKFGPGSPIRSPPSQAAPTSSTERRPAQREEEGKKSGQYKRNKNPRQPGCR